jgi:DNA-directed RNA polymerase specialized sigma24 family protein
MFCAEEPKTEDLRANHANRADFCEVFERELKPLYLLAFLLTANHRKAEQCFAATVEEASKEQAVFRNWVRSWIKRCLIKNAIEIVRPVSLSTSENRDLWNTGQRKTEGDDEINAVAQLPPLDRFIFVMSVLERYSPWECSVLLGCSPKQAAEARTQAFRGLPGPVALFPRIAAPASPLVEISAF